MAFERENNDKNIRQCVSPAASFYLIKYVGVHGRHSLSILLQIPVKGQEKGREIFYHILVKGRVAYHRLPTMQTRKEGKFSITKPKTRKEKTLKR